MNFKKEMNLKEYLRFLAPSILFLAFISAYQIVDGYFISSYVGSNALAAVNLILPLNSIIFAVGLMFAAGGGALVSMKLGEKDTKTASKYVSNLLMISIVFGLLASVLAFLFKGFILERLGVNSELWEYANLYSIFTFITFPFIIAKMELAGFLRAEGSPKISLIMTIIGGLANIILDFLFIAIFDMGVAGAGLATLLGIIISLIYASIYFKSPKSAFSIGFHSLDFKFLKSVIFNGSSEMVSELSIGFVALVFNLLCLEHAGNDGLAAISVILYIQFFVGNSFFGLVLGTSPLISYYYGAKNLEALKKTKKYALNTLLIVSPIVVGMIFLGKSFLVSIFFDAGNPAYDLAVQGLSIFTFGFLFVGYNMFGSAMFTALSNGKISAMIAFSKTFIVFSIIAYVLPRVMGVEGIWLIMPIVEVSIAFLVFYLTQEKKMKKYYAFLG